MRAAARAARRAARLAVRHYAIPLVSRGGACQVDFAVSPTAVPATTLGSQDKRALGIRFMGFTVKP